MDMWMWGDGEGGVIGKLGLTCMDCHVSSRWWEPVVQCRELSLVPVMTWKGRVGRWAGSQREIYMYAYRWFTSLYRRNEHNIVKQLYSEDKKKRTWNNGYILAHYRATVDLINEGAEKIANLHIGSQGMFGYMRIGANWSHYERPNMAYVTNDVFLLGCCILVVRTDSWKGKTQAGKHCREEENDAVKI